MNYRKYIFLTILTCIFGVTIFFLVYSKIVYPTILPVIKNISQICSKIDFITLYNNKKIKNQIKNFLGKKIKSNLFYNKDYVDIYKSRYLMISNGMEHVVCKYNWKDETFEVKKSIPEFNN